MSSLDPIPYSDAQLRAILQRVKTIAMVGASSNWNRPSYFVMKYLQGKGYRVIPVNPGIAGQSLLGETVYASLRDVPEPVDMVDVFRPARDAPAIVEDAIEIGAKVVWMQLGIRNDVAAATAEKAGIEVVMNRCPKIEFGRLGGELSWSGVNSGIIRNRPPEPPIAKRGRQRGAPPHNVTYGFETRVIHAGAAPDPVTGARSTPIYQTTSYVFEDVDQAASLFNLHNFGYIYSRLTNPTVAVLEERVASLEGGRAALAAASGHAAQFLIFFTLMDAGDEFVASRNLYGGSLTQFGLSFKKLGWKCHFVDPTDPENFRKALTPRTKAIFVENLANPGGIVLDLEQVATIAHEAGIPLIVDNTLATPYLCEPFRWGADIICHSTTKFLSGHGHALGGIVVESGRFDWSQGDRFPACLSRAQILREFRRLRVYHQGARGGVARFRPDLVADERVFDADRHRDPASAHGPPCRKCRQGRRVPRRPSARRLGLLCRAKAESVPRACPEIPAKRRRGSLHFRCQRGLRSRHQVSRERAPVLTSGQYRRHPEPDSASCLDDASSADRRAAPGGRRRPRCHSPLGRP